MDAQKLFSKTANSLRQRQPKGLSQLLEEISRLVKIPVRDTDPRHVLYSYPAKFQASVPSFIIENFSSKGELVLDPYGGGGTSAVCATLLGRHFAHYDLSPFSCLIAKAKTASVSRIQMEKAILLLEKKAHTDWKILTAEEKRLLSNEVSAAVNQCWGALEQIRNENDDLAAVLAVILMKLIKACGRRDAVARRNSPSAEHVKYVQKQLRIFLENCTKAPSLQLAGAKKIICASNHDLRMKDKSVDLIVTSPPYPGVDVEYAQVQLQRRDLNRCFRSNLPIRISERFFSGRSPSKKQLCNGGEEEGASYFSNAQLSLEEMRRVLKPGKFAFVYCGFKTELDQKRYEQVIRLAGFNLIHKARVVLSDDRVASSRSTHHGKDTNMMQRDILFVLV